MFDVEAQVPLEIRSFSAVIEEDDSDTAVQVFTKEGTYAGHEDTPASWTEICGAIVMGKGPSELTPIPETYCSPVNMIPNEVRSFYVTVGSNPSLLRTTPVDLAEGTVFARNLDMSIMVGKAVSGSEFNPGGASCQRQFNGAVMYVPEGIPNSGSTTYPMGGGGGGVSPQDPADGKLGSACYCDDCEEGTCSSATHRCEDEEAS